MLQCIFRFRSATIDTMKTKSSFNLFYLLVPGLMVLIVSVTSMSINNLNATAELYREDPELDPKQNDVRARLNTVRQARALKKCRAKCFDTICGGSAQLSSSSPNINSPTNPPVVRTTTCRDCNRMCVQQWLTAGKNRPKSEAQNQNVTQTKATNDNGNRLRAPSCVPYGQVCRYVSVVKCCTGQCTRRGPHFIDGVCQ